MIVMRYMVVKIEQTATGVADFYTVVDTTPSSGTAVVIARGDLVDMAAVRDALNASAS